MQHEDKKRKGQPISPRIESPEKMKKTVQTGGRFINALIGQWSKRTGIQFPLSQISGVHENKFAEELQVKLAEEECKVNTLSKKLQVAEGTIASLSTSLEIELRAKDEILKKLDGTWESIDSINNYSQYISDSLSGFQQHRANLTALYDDVIMVQQKVLRKLEQESCELKSKDAEKKKLHIDAQEKLLIKETRIQELIAIQDELKKQLENSADTVYEIRTETNAMREENLKLIKEKEKVVSDNEELRLQLSNIKKDKEDMLMLLTEKETCMSKLSLKYEEETVKTENLQKELESKAQEIQRLHENLNARKQIEADLAKDVTVVEKGLISEREKYKKIQLDMAQKEKELHEAKEYNKKSDEVIRSIKKNNEIAIHELHLQIETLRKSQGKLVTEKVQEIENMKDICKSLEENHKKELSGLKQQFEDNLSEMKMNVNQQNCDFTKLNAALAEMKIKNKNLNSNMEEMKKENMNLKKNLNEMKEHNDDLQNRLNIYTEQMTKKDEDESQLKDNYLKCLTELKQSEKQCKELQEKFQNKTKEMTNKLVKQTYDETHDDLQMNLSSLKSILKSPKRVDFHLTSSPEIFSCEERFDKLMDDIVSSQGQEKSNISEINQNKKTNDTKQERKFFKTRGAVTRSYGSQKKIKSKK